MHNLVDDLHWRVSYELAQNFDVIFLPSFETREMSAKKKRKIRTKTVRSILGLAHNRIQQKLSWMARKYNKRLVICNEAYTNKTASWTGTITQNLSCARTITDNSVVVDRDPNGARSIMLRALYGDTSRVSGSNRVKAYAFCSAGTIFLQKVVASNP